MIRTPITAQDTDAVLPMWQRVRQTEQYFRQFGPVASLSTNGVLYSGLSEVPGTMTGAPYPTLYAKPAIPNTDDTGLLAASVLTRARALRFKLAPFTPQSLPTADGRGIVAGHAIPVGFLPVKGCDVNWNGSEWETTAGLIPLSAKRDVKDIEFEPATHGNRTGVIYINYRCAFRTEDDYVDILGATLNFAPANQLPHSTGFVFNPEANTFSNGDVCSPVAYVIAPERGRAPVALYFPFAGAYPLRRAWMLPITGGGLVAP